MKTASLLVGLVVLLVSCISMRAEKVGAIPPDFGKSDQALLIIIGDHGFEDGYKAKRYPIPIYDHAIRNYAPKVYQGKFTFVNYSELVNEPYNNVNNFRFYLDIYVTTLFDEAAKCCYIFDRLEYEVYSLTPHGTGVIRVPRSYLKCLEKKRLVEKNLN